MKSSTAQSIAHPEDLLRILVDAVDEYAIFAMDSDGHILTWNAGAQRLKGYKADEIIGQHFSKFYSKEDVERRHPWNELMMAAEHGKYQEEGWRYRKDGAKFWASVTITALRDEKGRLTGFGKVTRDLTNKREQEEKLRESYANLEIRIQERTKELLAEKLRAEEAVKARDQFFSMASHELKTPLSSLKMQTQIRKRRIAKGDYSVFQPNRLNELCSDDERQVDRLTSLVDRMLDISRISASQFQLTLEKTEMVEVVEECIKRMLPALQEAGIECNFVHEQPIVGMWDRLRIEQVMSNLLTNAIKYAPGKPVEVRLLNRGDCIEIYVKDFGAGISAVDQEKIFLPFERAANSEKIAGLGLGLFISRKIAEAHGGKMQVESAPNRGTKFSIFLPVISEEKKETTYEIAENTCH